MSAVVRLLLAASAMYLGAQIARWEPGLAFPLGVIAACTVGLWLVRGYQAAVDAERDLDDAGETAAGEVVGAEFVRDQHRPDRREVRR